MALKQTVLKGCLLIIPYLIGVAISEKVISPDILKRGLGKDDAHAYADSDPTVKTNKMEKIGKSKNFNEDTMNNIRFTVHRNGEADACGSTSTSPTVNLLELFPTDDDFVKLDIPNKYKLDKFLTESLGKVALDKSACGPEQPPPEIVGRRRKTWGRGEDYSIEGVDSSFLTYCDMGEDHTPILPDHPSLVAVDTNGVKTLPCHFHTREGVRFTSYVQLLNYVAEMKQKSENTNEHRDAEQECSVTDDGSTVCQPVPLDSYTDVHIYAVPAGRSFVFAPSFIGEIIEINHVESELPIYLEVMSLKPRVFDILNFFDREESQSIVDKALKETSETHRIKRSSTGASGYNLNSQRTSENGFDTHGKTAIIVKKRCMKVLGFDTYVESFTDGLQVLRYNKTTAYIPHMDWIDDHNKREVHNFDSHRKGTNRFATILLYMSDLGEGAGGETLFKNAWPIDLPEDQRKSRDVALEELRESGEANFLKKGSWEETMVADCRSRLAVRPHSARAVLFYSQHPNGEEDTSSLHGGCPVLHGEKWAANLWVWNGPRGGFPGSPKNPGKEEPVQEESGQIKAIFENTGKDQKFKHAKLYFQETVWGDFSHGDPPHSINTFEGHEWNINDLDGNLLKRIVIPGGKMKQKFSV